MDGGGLGEGKEGGEVGILTLGDLMGDNWRGREKGTYCCFFFLVSFFAGSNLGGVGAGLDTIGLLDCLKPSTEGARVAAVEGTALLLAASN